MSALDSSAFQPLVTGLDALPECLQEQTRARIESWLEICQRENITPPGDSRLQEQLVRVFACSEYVASTLIKNPQFLHELTEAGLLERDLTTADIQADLENAVSSASDDTALMKVLRQCRHRAWIRIAWRDICEQADLVVTLRELSDYADACIDSALRWLQHQFEQQYGQPLRSDGSPQSLYVVALGKLGGRELNFSSDIDLIFGYAEKGSFSQDRAPGYEEYFTRLGRRLIQVLSDRTGDGFVFRVDMRLRPYGNSGPLAASMPALEDYYQNQGRNWERYALIKARIVAGDREAGQEFISMIQPFVYRRYLDYDAFESLREMKAMIGREVRRKGMEHNIKTGSGGIREVEFIGQTFQLVRGGREKNLQSTSLLDILEKLVRFEFLDAEIVEALTAAYSFLRRLENLTQAIAEEQTYVLPADEVGQARLVLGMGYPDWDSLLADTGRQRSIVHEQFSQIFSVEGESDDQAETEKSEDHLLQLWNETLAPEEVDGILGDLGYRDPAEVIRLLSLFRQGRIYKSIPERAQKRLDQLIPAILELPGGTDDADVIFKRLLNLIEAIATRSAYLALLIENRVVLEQLARLFAVSPWIATYLTRNPILLDELIDPRSLYAPLGKAALADDLTHRLASVDMDDLEQQMEVLRHFKLSHVLRVAAADIGDAMPLMVVSDHLTEIAEVILDAVLNIAWYQMTSRHGKPAMSGSGGQSGYQGFAIIAYGKMGGIELGYGSDLDLVFLNSGDLVQGDTDGPRPLEAKVFFARLAQRITHILSTRTPSGILYEVDTRLRPNGASGLLVSTWQAFEQYQAEKAWTWEHQALVRARFVAGDPVVGAEFSRIRSRILTRERDAQELRREVREMREKMRKHLGGKHQGSFALKQDRGGIADIEFIVQYAVLRWAHSCPELIEFSDNIRQIEALERNGLIRPTDAMLLNYAYRSYRARVHRATLEEVPAAVNPEQFVVYRRNISNMWQRWFEREEMVDPLDKPG